MKKITLLFIILYTLLIISCTKEGIDISKYPVEVMTYKELPIEVQRILKENVSVTTPSYECIGYSTDEDIDFRHYRKDIQKKGWLYEVNNNDDYFVVDNKIYRKGGNKGTPFIYHKETLYYGDLDIYDNYKERQYYKIVLESTH